MANRTKRQRINLGDVFQIFLPDSRYAYGRVYRDAGVGIYRRITDEPDKPPIGSRNFAFHVGMYRSVLTRGECPIIAKDPFTQNEDEWPPPSFIKDVLSGQYEIYHRGVIRKASREECQGLEPTAIWDIDHIVDRIMKGNLSEYVKQMQR